MILWAAKCTERRPSLLGGQAGNLGRLRQFRDELSLLIGGRVALERMIVCGVVVTGCVQFRLACRHVAVTASLPLCFRILRLGVRRGNEGKPQAGGQDRCGNRALQDFRHR